MTDPDGGSEIRRRVGLIVNPIAGLGGRVGLKGSDGAEIQRRARELGAVPRSLDRTAEAIVRLRPIADRIDLVTCPGDMGQAAVAQCGFAVTLIDVTAHDESTAEDTRVAAREMRRLGVDLLLFAGGDGTARDLYDAIGEDVVSLGIPAGVKIHSAAYAVGPSSAGNLAEAYLTSKVVRTREAEVIDVDEGSIRHGIVRIRLHGVLRVPDDVRRLQGAKAAGGGRSAASAKAIARRIVAEMDDDMLTVVGPGTTTRAVLDELGIDKTLLGVDVLRGRTLMAADVNEAGLLELLENERSARILVSPIGGQGYLFGRGNQQISPAVLRRVGHENILVIATPEKLNHLTARPLLVDTGDEIVDRSLEGHVRVLCGADDVRGVRVTAASATTNHDMEEPTHDEA